MEPISILRCCEIRCVLSFCRQMPPWVRDNPQVYMDPAFRGALPPQVPDMSLYYQDMGMEQPREGEVQYWEREDMGTVMEGINP